MNFQTFIEKNDLNTFEKFSQKLSDTFIIKGDDNRIIFRLRNDAEQTSFNKEVDGCVVDIKNQKVICYNPYYERRELEFYKTSDEQKQDFEWNNIFVEELIDGTVIRLYYDGEWKIATLHTIDASNAYWYSSKSFKELFLECSEHFIKFDKLNKERVYGFIIRHPENKIVTHYEQKDLVHIFTIDMNTFKEVDENLNIIKPRRLIFTNFNQMFDSCMNLMFYLPGYLIHTKSDKIKYISPHYTYVKNLKGNHQSMNVRYLQIRTQPNKVNELLIYYPEFINILKNIETKFVQKVNEMLKKYIDIKINKKWYELSKIEKKIIYDLHAIYLQNYIPMTFQTVYNYLNSMPYYKVAELLDIPLKLN